MVHLLLGRPIACLRYKLLRFGIPAENKRSLILQCITELCMMRVEESICNEGMSSFYRHCILVASLDIIVVKTGQEQCIGQTPLALLALALPRA
jgi:hypothetical protein